MNADTGQPGEARQKSRRLVGRRLLLTAGLTAVVAYGLVWLGVYVFQGELVYFPSADYHSTPSDVGLAFEEVQLKTQDGLNLAAWFVPRAEALGSVLFCHGNAGNMSDRLVSIQALHTLGFNVLIFDYRGYGHSEGQPNESGTYSDAEAAWRYLLDVRGESAGRVVIFGRSLGGAVAVELARRHEPAALIAEASFTNLADIAKRQYPFLPVRLLCRYSYDSASRVGSVMCPKLFVHAVNDELIPFANAQELYEAACEPKQFMQTPGGHNTGGFSYSPEHTKQVEEFLREHLGAKAESGGSAPAKTRSRRFRGRPR